MTFFTDAAPLCKQHQSSYDLLFAGQLCADRLPRSTQDVVVKTYEKKNEEKSLKQLNKKKNIFSFQSFGMGKVIE